jgi:hypothetical protein
MVVRLVALLTVAASLVASPAVAATLRVPSEYPTINAGLDAAASGDTVLVAPGTYSDYEVRGDYTSCAFLGGGVLLLSEAGPEATTIDLRDNPTTWANVVLYHYESEPATIEGFTITENVPDGGRVYARNCPRLIIRDCIFRDMDAAPDVFGGAIRAYLSDLKVEGCGFENCHALRGGAIWQGDGHILIADSYFENCSHRAVELRDLDQYPRIESAEIRNSRFTGNYSQESSGALSAEDLRAQVVITDCIFENNVSESGGGAATLGGIPTEIQGCIFVGNRAMSADSHGGALSIWRDAVVENNTFFMNGQASAVLGGAAVAFTLGSSEFRNNTIAGSEGGAAVYTRTGYATVTSSCNVFWENEGGIGAGFGEGPTDFVIDPQFCDPEGGDFHVAASSPCLAGNSLGFCGQIGALGEGCPDRGTIPSLLTANAADALVFASGHEEKVPALVHWVPGTPETIAVATPQYPGEGFRLDFASWSDGGDSSHVVTAPPTPTTYEATFDSLYYLTVELEEGGTATPPSGWFYANDQFYVVAVADSGYWFVRWLGYGVGCCGGNEPVCEVTMLGPILEIAEFSKNEDVRITTDPPGLLVAVDGAPYVSPVDFVWERDTEHSIGVDSLVSVGEGSRERFVSWSDGQPRLHSFIVPHNPLVVTATFARDYTFTNLADVGGSVSPEGGWRTAATVLAIEATADPYYIFEEWVGTGDGSYSGTDNPATVTINGPIRQGALFQRISHEVALSLSDTDPAVSTGAPVGLGFVHLWAVCSTEGGLKGFEGDVVGTMNVLAFTPVPGILNGGNATHLELASPDCLVGPTLLGSLVVQDDGGGNLCLVPSASHGFLGGRDCTNPTMLVYEWPADMRITGVATDGSAPCDSGRACDEDATANPVGVMELPHEPISYDAALEWSRPNPFTNETELRFTLAQTTHVTLSIYDVAGRLVRRLVDEQRGAGQHAVTWAGRDTDGRPLPTGVYFSRLVAGDFVQAKKLMLLRGD